MKEALGIGVILVLLGGIIVYYAQPPIEVQNTVKAAKWAEENLNMCVCDAWTCEVAVQKYMEAHNLTPEEFPYVCWSSDQGPPMSLSQKVGGILFGLGIFFVFYGLFGWIIERRWGRS